MRILEYLDRGFYVGLQIRCTAYGTIGSVEAVVHREGKGYKVVFPTLGKAHYFSNTAQLINYIRAIYPAVWRIDVYDVNDELVKRIYKGVSKRLVMESL